MNHAFLNQPMTNSSVSTITICYSARSESCASSSSKACREKQRRDRLNDKCVLFSDNLLIHLSFFLFSHSYSSFAVTHNSRFLELGALMDPGRPPKTDKAAILVDAVRMVTQLRTETQKLKDSNLSLQEKIKELKVILFFFTFFVYSSLLARISFCNPSFSFSWGRGMFWATDLILVLFAICNEVIVCSIYSLQPTFLNLYGDVIG